MKTLVLILILLCVAPRDSCFGQKTNSPAYALWISEIQSVTLLNQYTQPAASTAATTPSTDPFCAGLSTTITVSGPKNVVLNGYDGPATGGTSSQGATPLLVSPVA